MPVDLEMLMSAPSHIFYPYSSFESSYSDCTYERSLSFPQHHCVPRSFAKHHEFCPKKALSELFINNVCSPSKNCNIFKELSNVGRKKKVSFADDRGLNLVEVREIPSAPKWAEDVMTLLIGDAKRSVVKEKKWKVAFHKPPWSDEVLLEKLDKNLVVLEHVSVKEGAEDMLSGAVKVKNLAFEKKVFIRITYDRWQSYMDIPCTYVKHDEKNLAFDTFTFSTEILPIACRYEVIEFSVCFQCNGKEYWDNNGDINYRLIVEYFKSNTTDSHQTISKAFKFSNQCQSLPKLCETGYEMDIWSKILHSGTYC